MGEPSFALIGHPVDVEQIESSYQKVKQEFKVKNKDFMWVVFQKAKPHAPDKLTVVSSTGAKREGYFILCTFILEDLDSTNYEAKQKIFNKITDSCILADNMGIKISALGGMTSIAIQFYESIIISKLKNSKITSGNTLTAATCIEQINHIISVSDFNPKELNLTVLGGTGDIGSVPAFEFADKMKKVIITGRNVERLKKFAEKVKKEKGVEIEISTDNKRAVQTADIVIAATSAATTILESRDFKSGAIVCDVGYPKNINLLTGKRDDIIVFAGGMLRLQNPIRFRYDILNYRDDLLYGCFVEAIVLDFEERYENYSIGRGIITKDKMDEILSLSLKHGFYPVNIFDLIKKKYFSNEAIRSITSLLNK